MIKKIVINIMPGKSLLESQGNVWVLLKLHFGSDKSHSIQDNVELCNSKKRALSLLQNVLDKSYVLDVDDEDHIIYISDDNYISITRHQLVNGTTPPIKIMTFIFERKPEIRLSTEILFMINSYIDIWVIYTEYYDENSDFEPVKKIYYDKKDALKDPIFENEEDDEEHKIYLLKKSIMV